MYNAILVHRVFNGPGTGKMYVYCTDCLPDGVKLGNLMVEPLYKDNSRNFSTYFSKPPMCEKCGKAHDYVDDITTNFIDVKFFELLCTAPQRRDSKRMEQLRSILIGLKNNKIIKELSK